MTVIKDLTTRYSRRRFACLFFSLLVTLVASPVLSAFGFSGRFMEVFLVLNILLAVLITMFSLGSYAVMGLFVLVLVARGGHTFLGYGLLLKTSQGAEALLCLVSIIVMFRYALGEGRVTSERIFAALNVYLMGGIMCGLLFCIFEDFWPGSFSIQGAPHDGTKEILMARLIYFSFVTLGTLGYGDIIPIGGPAQALAVTEAIVGQMYLVVVVARLVSLYQGSSGQTAHPGQEKSDSIDEVSDASQER